MTGLYCVHTGRHNAMFQMIHNVRGLRKPIEYRTVSIIQIASQSSHVIDGALYIYNVRVKFDPMLGSNVNINKCWNWNISVLCRQIDVVGTFTICACIIFYIVYAQGEVCGRPPRPPFCFYNVGLSMAIFQVGFKRVDGH